MCRGTIQGSIHNEWVKSSVMREAFGGGCVSVPKRRGMGFHLSDRERERMSSGGKYKSEKLRAWEMGECCDIDMWERPDSLSIWDVMCNRRHICGVFERSSQVSGLVPDVSEFVTVIMEKKKKTTTRWDDKWQQWKWPSGPHRHSFSKATSDLNLKCLPL